MTSTVTAPPAEGDANLWSQTWAPICRSDELPRGAVRGAEWLGGRVVAWRDAAGTAHVQSAFCPHLGADLAVGQVVGDTLRCAFHHWEFGGDGRCVRTGSGDPVPPQARVYRFPTAERWGLIWAFNGDTPLYELPEFPVPASDLHWKTVVMAEHYALDPWVFLCNTLDFNHLKVVHQLRFEQDDPDADIDWRPHSVRYRLKGTRLDTGDRTDYQLGIIGNNVFWLTGTLNDRSMHFASTANCSTWPASSASGRGCAGRTGRRRRARSSASTVTSRAASWCRWRRR